MPLNRQDVTKLIAAGNTQDAIDALLEAALESGQKVLLEQVALQSNSYKNLNSARIKNTISNEEFNRQMAIINDALLEIARQSDEPIRESTRNDTESDPPIVTSSSFQKFLRNTEFILQELIKHPFRSPWLKWIIILTVLLHPILIGSVLSWTGWVENPQNWLRSIPYRSYYF